MPNMIEIGGKRMEYLLYGVVSALKLYLIRAALPINI